MENQVYTKYDIILKKYHKNNNLSWFRMKYNADFQWEGGFYGGQWGGGDGKEGGGVCQTWTLQQGSSIEHYYDVNLD